MKQQTVNSNETSSIDFPNVTQVVTISEQMLEKGFPQHKILATLIDAAEIIAGGNSVSSGHDHPGLPGRRQMG